MFLGISAQHWRFVVVPPSRALPPELADEEDDDSPALTPWDDGESDDSEHDYAVPVRKRLIGFSPVTATTEAAPKPEEQKEKKPTEPVAAPKVEEVKTEVPKVIDLILDSKPKILLRW